MTNKVQIIVIPGIMGSVLKKGYFPVWPAPISNTIYKSYKFLKDIHSEDISAKKMEPIIYKKLIEKLNVKSPHVTEFFYDWRQNNLKHLSLLEEKIMTDADEIIFIAHSMGGIITKLFLNHFSDRDFISKVSKVITLGTPWHGSLESYKALRYGTRIPDEKFLTNGIILNSKDSKSLSPFFPSTYQLLPSDKYLSSSQELESEPLIPYRIKERDYLDHKEFFNIHLKHSFEEFGHNYQDIIIDFNDLLSSPFPQNINHYEIIGNGKLTLSGINENSLDEAEGDYRNGDGTVPLFSALTNLSNSFFVNNVSHTDLPKNDTVIRLIDYILSTNRDLDVNNPQIFKSLDSEHNKKINGQLVKIACPVTTSLVDSDGEIIYGAVETIDEEQLIKLSQNNFDIHTLGNTTYLFIDQNEGNEQVNLDSIVINAYDKGPTTISIDLLENGHTKKRNAFKTFEIDPNLKATIKLSELIEESKVTIENIEHEAHDLSSVIFDNLSSSNSVKTEIEFDTSKFKHIKENTYVTKGNLEFKFSSSSESNDINIDETFIKINEEVLIVQNQIFKRSFEPGKYSIEYFSKDTFGNVEQANEISIIVLPDKLVKIDLEFFPQYYKINYSFDSLYKECLDIIKDSSFDNISLKFNEEISEDNIFKYTEKDKKYILSFNNIFNEHTIDEIQIDENSILHFFEGNANEQNLFDLMTKYDISTRNVKFISEHYNRTRTAINNEHIKTSKIIELSNDFMNLAINKETEYEIYFLNLSEDINLDLEDTYFLRFKVLIKGENIEQNDLSLVYDAKITFNNQIIPLEMKEIYFQDYYAAEIDLKSIKDKVDSYWKRDQIINFEVSIMNKIDKNIIRTQDFIIR